LTKSSDRRLALFSGLLALSFLLAYFPAWKNLVAAWYASEDYSHGFLILPLAAAIAWQRRKTLAESPVEGSAAGAAVLAVALALHVIGQLGEIVTLSSVSLVLAMAGITAYVCGWKVLRRLVFPFGLLLFMIPVPAQVYAMLTLPLQLAVTAISTAAWKLAGVPVYHEGNIIYLPEATLQVVDACSGLRSLMMLLALSAVFAHLTLRSNGLRLLLCLLMIPVSVAVNVLRVSAMIFGFHALGLNLTKGSAHTLLGILVFFTALALTAILRGLLAAWDR
jgi:exosortase A